MFKKNPDTRDINDNVISNKEITQNNNNMDYDNFFANQDTLNQQNYNNNIQHQQDFPDENDLEGFGFSQNNTKKIENNLQYPTFD